MKKILLAVSLLCLSLLSSLVTAAESTSITSATPPYQLDGKLVLGRVENVYFNDIQALSGVAFAGKIDTGADTTSMHATNIHVTSGHAKFRHLKDQALMLALTRFKPIEQVSYYDWNGALFAPYDVKVSFTVRHPYSGETIKITRPIERISRIRNRTEQAPILRPAILLPLTIAGHTVATQVNLTDRTQFSAPVLIGKTFLDHQAWVYAGYDYLQQQQQAQLIGTNERVTIAGLPQKLSYSWHNNYSALNASEIKVNPQTKQVTFTIDDGKQTQTMTRPLVRMLSVQGEKRPLILIPVESESFGRQYWQVYLTDRSRLSSQIRLGKTTLNRHFMLDPSAKSLLDDQAKTVASKPLALQVSGQETIQLDGIELSAEPSLKVQTPLLKVTEYETFKRHGKTWLRYTLTDSGGQGETFSKPISKRLKVGSRSRPVVFGDFTIHGQQVELAYALELLDDDETAPYFVIGRKMSPNGVLINTRSDHLLNNKPIVKAGHIEVAQVAGLSFPVKLDTGADVSSINAQNIELFSQDGKDMVRFDYQNDMGMEKAFTLEVVDKMQVKAKKGETPTIRPVVKMPVKLGSLECEIKVNLQDRGRFHYSMILGKNFLKHGVVVSSEQNYLLSESLDNE